MLYINPVEILGISDLPREQIDSATIKKAKRRLFADIDLSDDGLFYYHGRSHAKSDCERVIDELVDPLKLDFFLHLSTNYELNTFLATGDVEHIKSLRQESIYKLPEFIQFVSPYLIPRLDEALLKAFIKKDQSMLSQILSVQQLTLSSNSNATFKSLTNELSQRTEKLKGLRQEIDDEITSYTEENIIDVLQFLKDTFQVKLLNSLPQQFQSQINEIGRQLNFLAIGISNHFDNTLVPQNILKHVLELETESVQRPIWEKNFEIYKKRHQNQIEREKNAPILREWAKVLNKLIEKTTEVETEQLDSKAAFRFVRSSFNMSELNQLPDFGQEIREQIACEIRNISIASWNKQNDIESALELLDFSLLVSVSRKTKKRLWDDLAQLKELKEKYKGVLNCYFCEASPPTKGCEIDVTIFLETKRRWFPRSVEFSYSQVPLPRCKQCKKIHGEGQTRSLVCFIGLTVIGALTGWILSQTYRDGGFIFMGPGGGMFVGWLLGKVLRKRQCKLANVKESTENVYRGHPILAERMNEGWTFTKPTA